MEDCQEELERIVALASREEHRKMLQWYRENRDSAWPGDVERADEIFEALTEQMLCDPT